jgi:hypothetical protein
MQKRKNLGKERKKRVSKLLWNSKVGNIQ